MENLFSEVKFITENIKKLVLKLLLCVFVVVGSVFTFASCFFEGVGKVNISFYVDGELIDLGYEFTGWLNGGVIITRISDCVGALTLEALWVPVP